MTGQNADWMPFKYKYRYKCAHLGKIGRVEGHDPGECWGSGACQPNQGAELAADLKENTRNLKVIYF